MPRHSRRRAQVRDVPGLRHVATAAAVASGTMAVVTPIAGLDLGAAEITGDLRLASENTPADDAADLDAAAAPTAPPGPRDEPVLAAGDDLVRNAGLLEATGDAGRALAGERDRIAQEAAAAARGAGDDDPQPGEDAGRGAGPNSASCDIDTSNLGDVKSWVSDAAEFLGCAYGQPDLLGVGSRGNASDHPTGHALDLMVRGETGDRIAECAMANADELGVKYVIWDQQIDTGSGFEAMEDRGGDTANHKDHVHISFSDSAGSGSPDLGKCA